MKKNPFKGNDAKMMGNDDAYMAHSCRIRRMKCETQRSIETFRNKTTMN